MDFILLPTAACHIPEVRSMHKQTFKPGFTTTYTAGSYPALSIRFLSYGTGQHLQKLDELRTAVKTGTE